MRSLAGEARAARHAAVLDEATVEFNRTGVAGASLAAIAQRVGLTRAGIYNYCADRVDLVRQCYLRACDLTQADLARAAAGGGRGLDKVTTFIRLAVELDHAPVAVLSELAFLPDARRDEVRAARMRNVETLKALVGQGVEDGSIRACDADLACQTIFGMLAWAPLGRSWTDNAEDTFVIRMAAAIPPLIADGVAPDGARISIPKHRLADVITAEPGSEKDQRLEALARAGSRLFNRRGIDGVSLDDVAAEVGATKGLVYHYFDSKPAFVAHCYDRAFEIYDRIMSVAETGDTGLECSLMALELNVEAQLDDLHPLSLTTGFEIFSETVRVRFTGRTNSLAARSVELARRGVKDSSLRPFDLEPVALASAGAFSHLSKWLPPGDNRPVTEIAGEVSRFFLLGLRRGGGGDRG